MNNPEDLLQEWEALPDDAPSTEWQNRLLQRAEMVQNRRTKIKDARVQFMGLILIFVVFNIVFIAQVWQKQGHDTTTRQDGLAALSQQFFVKP
jgi:hypothetical protein